MSGSAMRWFEGLVIAAVVAFALGASSRPAGAICVSDCNGDGEVTVDEVVTAVNIALGSAAIAACPAADSNGDQTVSIEEILQAVIAVLQGCPQASPTATPTAAEPTPTPTIAPFSPSPTVAEPTPTPTAAAFTATPTPSPPETPSPTASRTATPIVLPTPVGQGVKSAIVDASFDDSRRLRVLFTLTADDGTPLTPVLTATQNPAQARVRFTLAHIEEYAGGGEFNRSFDRYVNDINRTRPAYDSGGTLETVDATRGLYRYTFRRTLENVVAGATYTVGLQVDRLLEGVQRSANPVFDFVPGGGTPQIRAGSTTAQCNSCHDPLVAHGNRRELRLCTLCHTQEAVDERGRSVDMGVMVHKIHRGKELPSVVSGPPGTKYAIYSSFQRQDIVFAEKHADGTVTGVGFPRAIEYCAVCHSDGATASYHLTRPSTAACTSCHDDVNPSTQPTAAGEPGTNHFQGRGFEDGDCAFCHEADSGREFDVSVAGAHVVPGRSRQLAGLAVNIVGLRDHGAGQRPTVSFRVTDRNGTALTDLSRLNRLAFTLSGPTTEYASMLVAVAAGAGASGTLAGPDESGLFTYRFPFPIPASASGTWAIGAEARRQVTLAGIDPIGPKTFQEAASNPVVTFSVDGSAPVVRRAVVDDQLCAQCHGDFSVDFSVHGNLRNSMEYCVMCHNPDQTDVARRRRDSAAVAAGDATATIDFKVLIHKIHTGEELEQKPYIVYGFGPPPVNFTRFDFSEVLFPGDRRNCRTCHLASTYLIPPFPGPAKGSLLTHLDPVTGNEVVDGREGPITSACTSCHDGAVAKAHAATQTTSAGHEACAVCHAEGRSFPVSGAHARAF
ncbi:MAG: OmcA/MtrC family decaheme c-type cytochrome [Candidatus Binatia bacterium]|nr:OmcA/MtrC family decaheme c-type cytochrome [Candidatus Binatia bacterium]